MLLTRRSLLNKLSPEKFDKLFKQLMEVDIKSQEVLELIIDQIFKKARLYPLCCLPPSLPLSVSHDEHLSSIPELGMLASLAHDPTSGFL
jgi:hypothetical protein